MRRRIMLLNNVFLALAVFAFGEACCSPPAATQEQKDDLKPQPFQIRGKIPPPLHVVGNQLQSPEGHTVRLQGLNIPSLEWSNTGDTALLKSVQVAMEDWNANVIRLPLSQDRWFGKANGQTDGGRQYRQIVENVVRAVSEQQRYVVLDLHWSDVGVWGQHIAQHKMPDEHSMAFWKDVAAHYANVPAVLFDLYNEPHDISWDVWKNGGTVTEKVDKVGAEVTYTAVGLQPLIESIRALGAKNVIVAGGLDWAYDLSGIAKGYALADPQGNGVIYSAHIYPWKSGWDDHVGVIAARYPIFVGEVGCEPDAKREDPLTWAPKILAYIESHQWSWTAWCFHPSASPRLLADWNYTPTPYWGVFAKNALARANKK